MYDVVFARFNCTLLQNELVVAILDELGIDTAFIVQCTGMYI